MKFLVGHAMYVSVLACAAELAEEKNVLLPIIELIEMDITAWSRRKYFLSFITKSRAGKLYVTIVQGRIFIHLKEREITMKLVTFTHNGETRIAALENGNLIDLHAAFKAKLTSEGNLRAAQIAEAYIPKDMNGFLQGGTESMNLAKDAIAYALMKNHGDKLVFEEGEVKIEAPVSSPGKIICVGHNYREHILEMKREIPAYPVIFAKFANTVIGPEDDIPFYPISEQLDYEAEFAFVIGKHARNVSEGDALDYIAGYTIVNDITYRDIQRRTIQWLQGKTVEGSAPMGPWLITSDELTNPSGLKLS